MIMTDDLKRQMPVIGRVTNWLGVSPCLSLFRANLTTQFFLLG